MVLQLGDFVSTYVALSAGGVEANPITRSVLEHHGWMGFFVMKCLAASAFVVLWPMMAWLSPKDARVTTIAMGIFAAIMALVVVNNAVVATIA